MKITHKTDTQTRHETRQVVLTNNRRETSRHKQKTLGHETPVETDMSRFKEYEDGSQDVRHTRHKTHARDSQI